MIVLKVGGSLYGEAAELLKEISGEGDVLIVPGGGVFADLVRRMGEGSKLSDEAAHWMAVLAMEQYGYYLADRSGLPAVTSLRGRGVRILLPYRALKSNDELPHTWDVTSDTIAAWIAVKGKASALIKATDVDGVFLHGRLLEETDTAALESISESCVDRALPGFLKKQGMDMLVVNGKYPERVKDAIRGKKTKGTMVRGR